MITRLLLCGYLLGALGGLAVAQDIGAFREPIDADPRPVVPIVVYVDASATGAGDGSSWPDAYPELRDALMSITSPPRLVVEIWVAQGTYTPGPPWGARYRKFYFGDRCTELYGGFPSGGGDSTFAARDPARFVTVLSGDLRGDDGPDFAHDGENSYTVVEFSNRGLDKRAVLDGVTITGGHANGVWGEDISGGGVYIEDRSPVLRNVVFWRNRAEWSGGGLFVGGDGRPTLDRCVFSENNAKRGGGMANAGFSTITDCLFFNNTAEEGAGLYNHGKPATLANCLFIGNSASGFGGGVLAWYGATNPARMVNCTLFANYAAESAGGLFVRDGGMSLSNSILWANADASGTAESSQVSTVGEDSVLNVGHCCAQNWGGTLGGTGNIGDDPAFVDDVGSDGIAGTGDEDLRLRWSSPCIDAGDNTAPVCAVTDLDGNPRRVDDPRTEDTGIGTGAIADMGAYEFLPEDCNDNGVPDDLDVASGMSADVNEDNVPDECEVYPDCNANTIPDLCETDCNDNGRPDDCDIADGTSEDCTNNKIPDECELDCNANQVADSCDIAAGTSLDLDHDGLPDECEVLYVDGAAPGPADGTSWATAYREPREAATFAADSGGVVSEIRVAGGTYETPILWLVDGVVIRGGYAGFGEPDPDEWDIALHETVLLGSVNASGVGPRAGLDGFTIRSGIDNYRADPTIIRCTVIGNCCGPGVRNHLSLSTFINCRLLGNALAGMWNTDSAPKLVNCLLSGNHDGGMFDDLSAPDLVNCAVIGNLGPGILSADSGERLSNCILWGNVDYSTSGERAQFLPAINSYPIINYTCVQGWSGEFGGVGNFGDDPRLLDMNGPDDVFGTLDDDVRLRVGSPCMDAGDNGALPTDAPDIDDDGDPAEIIPLDLDDAPRIVSGTVNVGPYEGPTQQIVLSADVVSVPEGDTASFGVSLLFQPTGAITVTAAHTGGDADIFVTSGGALSFDAVNYFVPQSVILAASEDIDLMNDRATISVSAPGFTSLHVTATEADNEPAPSVIFVDAAATGGSNIGTSWAHALVDLQDALALASARDGVSQIWVAAGTYTPDAGDGNRLATFGLIDGVSIYGGFAGDEDNLAERDPLANETILSGDLNRDDGPEFENYAENSYHVVTSIDNDSSAVLDGFTIRGGNADGRGGRVGMIIYAGGGLYSERSRCALHHIVFRENSAVWSGGGMCIRDGGPPLSNCSFIQNRVTGAEYSSGGGLYNLRGSPVLTGCAFIKNTGAAKGGGFYNYDCPPGFPITTDCVYAANSAVRGGGTYNWQSSPAMTNCAFFGNRARYGAGVFNRAYCHPLLANCVFSGNSAEVSGGGMSSMSGSEATLANCTYFGNAAGGSGGGLCNSYQSLTTVTNCVFWENVDAAGSSTAAQIYSARNAGVTVVNYSAVQGGWGGAGGAGIITDDPLLVDPDGPDDIPGTVDDDLHLAAGSPCIDAGDNNAVPRDVTTDFDGNPRFWDDPSMPDTGAGTPPIVDIGAFEVVDCNGNGLSDDIASIDPCGGGG